MASDSHLDLSRAPYCYVLYGVKYIDLVPLAYPWRLFQALKEALEIKKTEYTKTCKDESKAGCKDALEVIAAEEKKIVAAEAAVKVRECLQI